MAMGNSFNQIMPILADRINNTAANLPIGIDSIARGGGQNFPIGVPGFQQGVMGGGVSMGSGPLMKDTSVTGVGPGMKELKPTPAAPQGATVNIPPELLQSLIASIGNGSPGGGTPTLGGPVPTETVNNPSNTRIDGMKI